MNDHENLMGEPTSVLLMVGSPFDPAALVWSGQLRHPEHLHEQTAALPSSTGMCSFILIAIDLCRSPKGNRSWTALSSHIYRGLPHNGDDTRAVLVVLGFYVNMCE